MNDEIENNLPDIARLRWACRRGMLELDVLLSNFLEQAYLSLSEEDKHAFIKLLECADPDLFAWLMGHEVAIEPEFIHIIEVIRRHAKRQFSD